MTRRPLLIAAWGLCLAALAAALLRPAPLLLNLGAGDEPFARGFRGSWERDGLQGSGETQFRWTLDGARLELPFTVRAQAAQARLRVARFAATPAEVTLLAGEREVARWRQPPRGWRVETVALGALQGPLTLRFRSQPGEPPRGSGAEPRGAKAERFVGRAGAIDSRASDSTDEERGAGAPGRNGVSPRGSSAGIHFRREPPEAALGVALDWVEIQGVASLWPDGRLRAGLLALLLGVPLLAGLVTRRLDAALSCAVFAAAVAAAAVGLDRFGGLVAVGVAGPPLLLVLALLAAIAFGLARVWPEHVQPWTTACAAPAALALVALVALSHPFFYYPDVDTHARFVRAIGQDGSLLLDPGDYQLRTGAWTREVGGRPIAFPYSPVFHVLASPLAVLWDEVRAVKALGVLAAAVTVLLVHVLGRGLGLAPPLALVAQALLALLPVTASRLTLALFPALLGQALEVLLLAHLVRRLDHLEGARDSAAAFGFLLLAQLAYTGSMINVTAVVLVLAAVEALRAEWRRAARLLGAWGLSLGLVGAVLYARFLPVLWQQVLPHAREVPGEAAVAAGPGALAALVVARVGVFYDVVFPLLLVLGLLALRAAPVHPRRVLLSALFAGGLLLVLRFTAPALFRDAKEVELLAPPVCVLAAAAVGALFSRGRPARMAGLALLGWALVWCAFRDVALYGARFLAVGR